MNTPMEAETAKRTAARTEAPAAPISFGLPARAWRRAVRFEREWHAAAPSLFAGLALALLLYNHVERQVTDVAFWLGLALIGTVFVWLLQNNRRQSRLDPVSSLPNRLQLQDDLREGLASSREQRTLVLLELEGLSAYRDRYGYEAGDELLGAFAHELCRVGDLLGGTAYRMEAGQFCALLPTGGRQPGEIVMAISVAADEVDSETPGNRPNGTVTLPDEAGDPDAALKLASERLAAHRQRQRRSTKRQAQDALTMVLGARRPELESHVRAVAFRAISVGRLLGLGQSELDDVVSAAKLQNIGLMSVPDSILDKPASLTPEESEVIRRHPAVGAAIISAAPALESVAALVRASCEHYDGSGYPDGLAGEAIPLGSRIVAVCVAYTALTSERPYRPARTPEEALEVVSSAAGAQFDPRVVQALAEDLSDEDSRQRATPLSRVP
jgi:HD-GYP domain-containing protein (c-di-GMP phosphodiesterase class II)